MKARKKPPEKERPARLGQQAAPQKHLQDRAYRTATLKSSVKDQIGLLLWFLCSPLSQQQSAAGYQLLEVLLVQSYQESPQTPRKGGDTAVESRNAEQPDLNGYG